MGVRVVQLDLGKRKIIKNAQELARKRVSVGVFKDSEGYDTPEGFVSGADVAMFNEFGTDTIPERSFIRQPLRAKRRKLSNTIVSVIKKLNRRTISVDKARKEVAKVYVDVIKDAILKKAIPPNAPLTIKLKGRDDPLVDTYKLYNNIKYKIESKGKR